MKYNNRKTIVGGISFDSQREARRYQELLLLQRAGKISDLKLQEKYELIPAQKENGKVVERGVFYKADFTYIEDGKKIVEDTKGYRTKEYIIKRKLMLYRYGIKIREV